MASGKVEVLKRAIARSCWLEQDYHLAVKEGSISGRAISWRKGWTSIRTENERVRVSKSDVD